MGTHEHIAAADAAAARGDLGSARRLVDEAIAAGGGSIDLWMRQAALARAAGDARAALAATEQALSANPLHFMALLLRASLLEQLGDPLSGEVYGWALAQLPEDGLDPGLVAMVDHARRQHAAHVAKREEAMERALAAAHIPLEPGPAKRLARFRSNAVRRTRHWHSEPTEYHYPGLAEAEFHDRDRFPWLAELEAACTDLQQECAATMLAERGVPYVQYPDTTPVRQWGELNHNRQWTALHLLQNGERVEENARHCPRTMALLERLPQPRIGNCSPNAMFSLLAPRTAIPPHVGVNNARLVCHLPLVVPEGCWFRVGGETRPWREGEAFVFDDTIEHEAVNPSDHLRIVFIMDCWHPDLSEPERQALSAMLATDVVRGPGL